MRLTIIADIDTLESGITEEEVKADIIEFTKDLLILGALEQGIGFALREVRYENKKGTE